MRFHTRSKERKGKHQIVFYLKAMAVGVFLSCVLIFSGIGVKVFIKFLIKYWVWAVVIIAAFILAKNFLLKRKHR